jgi:ankyrin repeat protein
LGANKEIVELLIAKGADVNVRGFGGMTPLNMADDEGEKKIAALLRKHGGKTGEELEGGEPVAEATQPEPPTGKTPDISIHEAADEGNIEAVKKALAAGTDVNAKSFGLTPLHQAASKGHKEIAELLISKGADVNAKDNDGGTPLGEAIQYKRTEIADLLRKHGGKSRAENSIHIAARTGNHEAVKQHLAAGADVNTKNKLGRTPLSVATTKEIAELLIANGADVNAKIEGGWTPLHIAAQLGHKEIVELLLANGADVNAKAVNGGTPLHAAAFVGRKEIAALLIAKGADMNAKMEDGRTPLDVAIKYNKTETADLLRKHGGRTGEELKAAGK